MHTTVPLRRSTLQQIKMGSLAVSQRSTDNKAVRSWIWLVWPPVGHGQPRDMGLDRALVLGGIRQLAQVWKSHVSLGWLQQWLSEFGDSHCLKSGPAFPCEGFSWQTLDHVLPFLTKLRHHLMLEIFSQENFCADQQLFLALPFSCKAMGNPRVISHVLFFHLLIWKEETMVGREIQLHVQRRASTATHPRREI